MERLPTSVIGAWIPLLCLTSFLSAAERGPAPAPPVPELKDVTFSVPSGVYTNKVTVSVSAEPPAASIHYTIDGTEPSTRSPLFARAIEVTNSLVLKARAFDGAKSSRTVAATYTLLDESLLSFDSNLPLVIINSFGREIGIGPPERAEASVRIIESKGGRTKLDGAAALDSRTLVNLRGHTSLRYPKRSYRLKLCDAQGHPAKASVLGLPKDADWILYAPYSDKTMIRDVLAYEISNQMGQYAPRTRYVEVFVNKLGGKLALKHYMGVFVLEEKIERGKGRVAVASLGPQDNEEPAISGGYILKKDHTDSGDQGPPNIGGFPNGGGMPTVDRDGYPTGPGGFPGDPAGFLPTRGRADPDAGVVGSGRSSSRGIYFVSPHGSQLQYVEPKATEITLEQRRWISQYIRKMELALYGPDFRDPEKGYAAWLDPDSFIDYHWLVEATKNIDGFRFSTFFHKDRAGKLRMGPVWDWNLSMGAANGKQGYMAEYWYWPQLDDQQYSWYRRLFEDPEFAQRYVDRWGQLRTNQLSSARLAARIDELAGLLSEAQGRNYRRWKILGRQVWPNHYTGKTYEDEVQFLKNWMTQRLAWIDRQFVPAPNVSIQQAAAERKVALKASAGKVYYTVDGTDPRGPGGMVSPRAQAYKGPVLLNAGSELRARALDGKRWSYPATVK